MTSGGIKSTTSKLASRIRATAPPRSAMTSATGVPTATTMTSATAEAKSDVPAGPRASGALRATTSACGPRCHSSVRSGPSSTTHATSPRRPPGRSGRSEAAL